MWYPAGADRWLHAFSVRELPKSPSDRFKALFAERPRWTRDEIEPYLTVRPACARCYMRCADALLWTLRQGVEEAGATVDGLLLAWCRHSQPTPDSVGFYTARSTC